MLHDNAKPLLVLVPLPSSSIMTNDLEEAAYSILDVSNISAIKVDYPLIQLSEAPTLVIIASTIGI